MTSSVYTPPSMRNRTGGGPPTLSESLIPPQAMKVPSAKKLAKQIDAVAMDTNEYPPIVTLDDIPAETKYCPELRIFKPTNHVGQRKLFLTELQFFTDEFGLAPATVIYAGAAPSNHTGFLARLFPAIKWILVDPNAFDIFGAEPVMLRPRKCAQELTPDECTRLFTAARDGPTGMYIINDIFTQDMAAAAGRLMPGSYFISDIRTNIHAEEGRDETPDTLDILWNLAQQYNWISEGKFAASMLKFRHPFYGESPEVLAVKSQQMPYSADFARAKANGGPDFVANAAKKRLVYLDGKINLQAWPGISSTETRLITRGMGLKDYGTPDKYEDRLFYYNCVARPLVLRVNPNASRRLGFDHCNDCALENLLWERYVALGGGNVQKYVEELSRTVHRSLRMYGHGDFFAPRTPQDIEMIKVAYACRVKQ